MFVVVTADRQARDGIGACRPTIAPSGASCRSAALPLGFFLITLTLYTYIDTVILGIMRTDAETGWYAASYRVYEGLMYAPSTFATVLTPRFSQLFVDDRGRPALAVPALAARLGAVALVIGGAGVLAGAADAAAVLRCGLRAGGAAAAGPGGRLDLRVLHLDSALGRDRHRTSIGGSSATTAIGLIANIALNILFIPRLGHHRRGVGDGDRGSADRDAAVRAGPPPAGGRRTAGVSMTPRQTADGRGARRRAVRLVRVLLRGRRLEPELALRAHPRDPRAAHAADRRVSAAHRRSRVLARPLLHRQGARRVAAGARSRCRRRVSFRARPASTRRRFPASPGRRTSPRVVTSGVFTVVAALCVFWLSLRWGASDGAALFAATAYGLAHAGVGLRDALHGTRADGRLPDDRVCRRRRARRRHAAVRERGWPGSSASPAAGPWSPSFRPRSRRSSSACWRSRRATACGRAAPTAVVDPAHRRRRRDRGHPAAGLQHARLRIAVPPRLRERRRLQGAADRLLRHHVPEPLDACASCCSAAIAACCRSRR